MNFRNLRKISLLAYGLVVLALPFIISSCGDSTPRVVPDKPLAKVFYDWRKVVVGADLSSVNMVEDQGGIYKDSSDVPEDPFAIFKKHGCNMVRVRLFKDPTAAGGYNADGYGGIADVIKTMQRAKEAGIAVTLDLHFSDTWADPGAQKTPLAWSGLNLATLQDSVYNYVTSVLTVLKNRNLVPDLIQVGNEVQSGMLFPVGEVGTDKDFTNFALLLQAGINAIRDFTIAMNPKPLIVLHPGKPEIAEYWFGKIKNAGITDYDVAAISYYDNYTTVNFNGLLDIIPLIKGLTGKKVLIAETSYQWTNASEDGKIYNVQESFNGFSVTRAGQFEYLWNLTQIAVTAGGMGVIAWEPAWIGNDVNFGQETIAFFDYTKRSIPAINFFTYPYGFPN